MRRLGILCFVLVAAAFSPASAGTLTVSDSMTVFDSQGNPVHQLILYENGTIGCLVDGECAQTGPGNIGEDPNSVYYFTNVAIDTGMWGDNERVLEPDSSNGDMFGVALLSPENLVLGFSSDTETIPVPYPNGQFGDCHSQWEGDGYFDATGFLSPDLRNLGYTAQFYSDTDVPEPSTLTLFGGALLAAFGLRKLVKSGA
ncbi:MAG: PEP-CTERM sorting domain-containing protein [Bryobacteraceae bacterium]